MAQASQSEMVCTRTCTFVIVTFFPVILNSYIVGVYPSLGKCLILWVTTRPQKFSSQCMGHNVGVCPYMYKICTFTVDFHEGVDVYVCIVYMQLMISIFKQNLRSGDKNTHYHFFFNTVVYIIDLLTHTHTHTHTLKLVVESD